MRIKILFGLILAGVFIPRVFAQWQDNFREMALSRSCPWASDYRSGADSGHGDQCGADGLGCCTPPGCPAGWTDAGTEAVLTKATCRHWSGCMWNDATSAAHPVAVGRVVRHCVKNSAGTIITRSCPWGSGETDAHNQADKGWGNQCNMTTDNCCKPADCPAGWTDLGKEAIATDINCPGQDICTWDANSYFRHPVAIGRVVRYCVKE
ncbi:MAG: hypothetical protein PHT59_03035 [Candidatus Omnitrophica bacterium]|nr:hypothetical protein [Candidatus Omnitrophota bacterium]